MMIISSRPCKFPAINLMSSYFMQTSQPSSLCIAYVGESLGDSSLVRWGYLHRLCRTSETFSPLGMEACRPYISLSLKATNEGYVRSFSHLNVVPSCQISILRQRAASDCFGSFYTQIFVNQLHLEMSHFSYSLLKCEHCHVFD